MFALVDCNNFYASCERLFRPDLIGKPIVVLSNNDGCVIARSNEAKACGIPMGAVAYQYEKIFTEKNIHVFSSNYALYGDMSGRVMTMLSEYSPEIEVYSIDEAFLKFEGCDYLNLQEHGEMIRKKVTKGTGIPISIGFAPTKALSKLANKIAKKFPVTKGVYVIDDDIKRIKALKWLPVEDVWGIGHRHAKRLKSKGVKTAFDFTQLSDEYVRKQMSVVGLRLKHELEGKNSLDLEETGVPKKNIATTRSFDSNYTDIEYLKERVTTFAVTCAEKLRKQNSCCTSLMVFIHTNGFREDLNQYSKNIVIKLPFPTNSSIEIARYAVTALSIIFRSGYEYKKAGVIVSDIVPENTPQISLFENSDPRHKELMKVIDTLNNSFGEPKIRLASQDLRRTWKMRQERLSPRYTTKFSDLIKVHV